jgi:hypothetical protein
MNAIAKQLGVSTPSILNWILRQRTRRAFNRIRARAWLSWNWTNSGISFKKKPSPACGPPVARETVPR